MPDTTQNPVRSCLFVHAGSDFDALDARFLGKGEGRGGMQIRPLGDGFYGYLARDEEEAAQALRFARAYLKHAPTQERAIHAFSVHLKPGDVQFGSVWDDALLSDADRQARNDWAAANAIAPGPERLAAYDALYAKYPRVTDEPKKAFRTEVLSGIGLIEIAANDLARLERAGKWTPNTDDAQILSDMRGLFARHPKAVDELKGAVLNPNVVLDDGDMEGALYAEFDEEAYLRFGQDRAGNLRLQSIHASDAFRGRDMLDWLSTTYGRPIAVNEVTAEAAGFWERMQSEGLIAQWSERSFTGVTVAVTSNSSTVLRMESAQEATKFLEELPRKATPHV